MASVFLDENAADDEPTSEEEPRERSRGFHELLFCWWCGQRDDAQDEQEDSEDERECNHESEVR